LTLVLLGDLLTDLEGTLGDLLLGEQDLHGVG
jgi:hypothetical protein